ncbi:MAG: hypothetical protein WD154_08025 [Nitrosopumilaceae archaeon]
MANRYIWIGIVVSVFFIGIGISYAIFSSTYDPITMKFRNQELFDQIMSNNPKMSATWMETMDDPKMQQQMMNSKMDGSMMSNMKFNVNAPITIPMIDGYYKGERVYFIHTEISDENMAQMMSSMVNFPTLYVSDLENISQNELANVYVFTNGVPGMGPYGGGPFTYQIDIFDSIPDDENYSQFRVPHLVSWNNGMNPRVLTSVEQLMEAEKNGEVSIQPTQNVVNAPMIVWKDNGEQKTAKMIPRIFESMSQVEGEVLMADTDMYFARINLHSINQKNMMMP